MKESEKIEAIAYMYFLSKIEAKEFYYLLEELRGKYFKDTGALSNYVVKNNLMHKYPNITGTVGFKDNGATWDLEGGFSKLMYERIKSELAVSSRNTTARSVSFTSYQDSNKNYQK